MVHLALHKSNLVLGIEPAAAKGGDLAVQFLADPVDLSLEMPFRPSASVRWSTALVETPWT